MIETTAGPIDARDLGVTSMHDHVLSDSSRLQRAGVETPPEALSLAPEHLGYLRWNMLADTDNLRLDEPDRAVAELSDAVAVGQRAVVECSSWGLGPDHSALPAIARRSGMTIVSAYGTYVPSTVPPHIAELDEEALGDHFFGALTVEIPGAGYRAAMLGIMGTTADLAERERVQLRAAGRAAARTGAAVSVRLDPDRPRGLEVLRILGDVGVPSERVVFSNVDEYMDTAVWDDLADAGSVLEMCFGTEAVHVGRVDNPSDRERLAFFTEYGEHRPTARHVLGQSLWTKMQLRSYGGHGYGHLVGRIVPILLARGFAEERVHAMLVTEPAAILDRGSAE